MPAELNHASVGKVREKGRVTTITSRVVFGTVAAVLAALGLSRVSRVINTAFVKRHNATDQHRNARKTYRFSKDWRFHEAVTYFTMYSYNFTWLARTSRTRDEHDLGPERAPAMAAGLTDHVWSMSEWLSFPVVQ